MRKDFQVTPALINSANPWCSTLEQLRALYACPHTGAVTTRTTMLAGFPDKAALHQFAFFTPETHQSAPANASATAAQQSGSLNTLVFSPYPLADYLASIDTIGQENSTQGHTPGKPFIISVAGTAEEVASCYRQIRQHQYQVPMPLAMEVNLSCPNVPDQSAPAYDGQALLAYLQAIGQEQASGALADVPVSIKMPPFTYHEQYQTVIQALLQVSRQDGHCPIHFITATNTLGSALLLEHDTDETVLASADGSGIGGLAGTPIHPLALGNVYTYRQMLNEYPELASIGLIGVGGVADKAGFERMRRAGADIVGVGTALGRKGLAVFAEIASSPAPVSRPDRSVKPANIAAGTD